MMPTETYRELRHFLLVRMALAAGALVVVGAIALTQVPAAENIASPPLASSAPADRPGQAPAVTPGRSAAHDAAMIAPMPSSMGVRDVFAKPELEEVMRPIAALVSLEGKDFEVLLKSDAPEAASFPAAESEPDKKGGVQKLPKGPHLQAGIFAQPANAEEFRRKLAADGYPAYIETRVHIGPYANRKEADRVREKLKAQGTTTVYVPQ